MPPIKRNDVVDKSVEKAFIDLNKALGDTVKLLSTLVSEGKELNDALKSSTGLKAYNDNLKKLNASRKTAAELTKDQANLLKQEEQLKQQVAKTTAAQERAIQAKNRTSEQERRIAEKNARQTAKNTSEYAKQSRRLTELRNKAKDLALTQGENSKAFIKTRNEVTKLDKRLKSLDASLGQNQRSVGLYEKALGGVKGAFVAVTGAVAAASGVIKLSKEILESTQSSGDKLTTTLDGMTKGWDAFKKSVASGDSLPEIIRNIDAAIEAGEKYSQTLDDLGDRRRSLTIAERKSLAEIEELKKKVEDVTFSYEERLSAGDLLLKKEEELLKQRQDVSKRTLEAEVELSNALTGLKQDEILAFVESYTKEEELRKNAQAFIEEEDKLRSKISANTVRTVSTGVTAYQTGNKEIVDSSKAALEELNSSTDSSVKAYAEVLRGYGRTTDEELDRIVTSYSELIQAEQDYFSRTKEINNKLNTLRDQQAKEAATLTDAEKLELAKRGQILEQELDVRKEIQLDGYKVEADQLKESTKAFEDAEKAKTELAKEESEKRKEIQKVAAVAGLDLINTVAQATFESAQTRREEETQAELLAYDERLNNEKLSEDQRAQIEKEKTQREKELRKRNAVANKRDSLFQVGINTLVGISKTFATLGFPAGVVPAGILAAQGAVQAAIISARPIPQFDKGTNSLPELSEVAEKRPEFVISKNGVELFDKPTILGKEYKGSKVIGGSETAQLLEQANRQAIMMNVTKSDDNQLNKAIERAFGKHTDKVVAELQKNRPIKQKHDIQTELLRHKLRN